MLLLCIALQSNHHILTAFLQPFKASLFSCWVVNDARCTMQQNDDAVQREFSLFFRVSFSGYASCTRLEAVLKLAAHDHPTISISSL
jgi:hypothetical protein